MLVGSCPPPNSWLAPTAMPAMASEQNYAANKLAPAGAETDTLVNPGPWSNPASWQSGKLPAAGAKIAVAAAGIYDLPDSPPYKWIRIDGSLTVDNSADRILNAEMIVVMPTGTLTINFPTKHFVWNILDSGPIDTVADPKQMGRGLIAIGIMNPDGTMAGTATVNINGAPKTPFATIKNAFGGTAPIPPVPRSFRAKLKTFGGADFVLPKGTWEAKILDLLGPVKAPSDIQPVVDFTEQLPIAPPGASQEITLTQPVSGWEIGDVLLLPGTVPNSDSTKYQDDVRTITAINGQVVTLDRALTYDHVAIPGMTVYVANLTRNVKIQSANTSGDPQRNGHIMMMHTDAGSFSNFEMVNLGRTDALKTINDPTLDANGKLVSGTGTNPRARYAIHWHRLYNYDPTCLVTISGCVVNGSPGVGITNHSSNVVITGNVIYKVVGQGIMAEAGDETGSIEGNFIAHMIGRPGADRAAGSRQLQTDLTNAKQGNGIWLTNAYGVAIRNNVTTECPLSGTYVDGARLGGLISAGFGVTMFPNFLLPPDLAHPGLVTNPSVLPLEDFTGNISIADSIPFWQSWQDGPDGHPGVIKDFTAWNCFTGAGLGFVNSMDFVHCTLLGSDQIHTFDTMESGTNQNFGVMITLGYGTGNTYTDMRVENFNLGIQVPRISKTQTVVHGGYYNNAINIWIGQEFNWGPVRTIDGDVKFGTYDRLAGRTPYNYYLDERADLTASNNYAFYSDYIKPSTVLLNTTDHPGMELWQARQAGSVNPWNGQNLDPVDLVELPHELTNLTNAEAQAKFGRTFLGQCAPADAAPLPLSNGLISKAIPPPPNWNLSYYTIFFNKPDATLNIYSNYSVDQSNFTVQAHLNHEGFNFVPISHDGQNYAVLAHLDLGPATISVSPFQPSLSVSMANLSKPFTLYYYVNLGKVNASNRYTEIITPSNLPLQTRPDGSKFVSAHVTGVDKSGNQAAADIAIEVTA